MAHEQFIWFVRVVFIENQTIQFKPRILFPALMPIKSHVWIRYRWFFNPSPPHLFLIGAYHTHYSKSTTSPEAMTFHIASLQQTHTHTHIFVCVQNLSKHRRWPSWPWVVVLLFIECLLWELCSSGALLWHCAKYFTRRRFCFYPHFTTGGIECGRQNNDSPKMPTF